MWALTPLHTAGKWTTLSFHSILSSFHFSPRVDEQRGELWHSNWDVDNKLQLFVWAQQTDGLPFLPSGHRWLRLSANAHLFADVTFKCCTAYFVFRLMIHLISVSKCPTCGETGMHDRVWSGVGHACEETEQVYTCLYGISEMLICICSSRKICEILIVPSAPQSLYCSRDWI